MTGRNEMMALAQAILDITGEVPEDCVADGMVRRSSLEEVEEGVFRETSHEDVPISDGGIKGTTKAPIRKDDRVIESGRGWVVEARRWLNPKTHKAEVHSYKFIYRTAPDQSPSLLFRARPDEYIGYIPTLDLPACYDKKVLVPVRDEEGRKVAVRDDRGRQVVKHQWEKNPHLREILVHTVPALMGNDVFITAHQFLAMNGPGRRMINLLKPAYREAVNRTMHGDEYYDPENSL